MQSGVPCSHQSLSKRASTGTIRRVLDQLLKWSQQGLKGDPMSRRWFASICAVAALAALSVYIAHKARAASAGGPKVIDRDSIAYGRTYGEWSAAWEQWAGAIPTSKHPLFDNGDCSTGQTGPVWFLGGKFCPNGEACTLRNIVRNCSVPTGKALYFPILNSEDSVLEERLAENPGKPQFQQIPMMRAALESYLSNAKASCTIDGVAIPQLMEKYRVQSVAFSFTLPADNYFTSFYGIRFPEGSFFPAVDDGWFVMLTPLPPGHHVLKWQGTSRGSSIGVQYNLNIQ